MSVPTTLRPADAIPGPRGRAFVGVAPDFLADPITMLTGAFESYGDLVAFPFGPRRGPLAVRAVAAFHPDAVQEVLSGAERTIGRGRSSTRVLEKMIGRNLMTTEGQEWRKQRRTLQPSFTPKQVAGYADAIVAEAERITDGSGVTGEVDLHATMLRYSLRVVGRALFSGDIDHVAPDLHPLIPEVNDLVIKRTTRPANVPLTVPTPENRRFVATARRLRDLVVRTISATDRGATGGRDDLVTRLRAAQDPETGDSLGDQELLDQTMLMMIAGHETTATALTFTLHQLARDSQLQDRLVADVEEITGGGRLTAEHLQRRDTVMRASLLEGMRLYPPVYMTEHSTTETTEIGGHAVPGGTTVFLSPWVTQRHPEYWPDPERFDPDRFLGPNDRPRYAYLPFGGGPHVCIGEHFALMAASALLGEFLRRYRLDTDEPSVPYTQTGNLRPSAPVRVTVTPRT